MRISADCLRRSIAGCLALFLAVPFGEAATASVRPIPSGRQAAAASSTPPQSGNPDRTAAADSGRSAAPPNNPGAASQTAAPPQSSSALQSPIPQQQNPVGTAAAPYVKALGIPASRPAGAAIAPAKQKRAHSFLIKVGVIVGAAIAIGTVVGLSKASPSRPN